MTPDGADGKGRDYTMPAMSKNPVTRNVVDRSALNPSAVLPYELRSDDFVLAIQDVYDFFFDVNVGLVDRGLERLDDMLRPAIMSGLISC